MTRKRFKRFQDFTPGKISERHEAFVTEYLKDGNGVRAYLVVWPSSSRDAARTSSARLLRRPEIAARLNEERDKLLGDTDAEQIRSQLQRIVNDARSSANEKLRALKLLGDQLGMWSGNEARETNVVYELRDEPMSLEEWEALAAAASDSEPAAAPAISTAPPDQAPDAGDVAERARRLLALYGAAGAAIDQARADAARVHLAKHGPEPARIAATGEDLAPDGRPGPL